MGKSGSRENEPNIVSGDLVRAPLNLRIDRRTLLKVGALLGTVGLGEVKSRVSSPTVRLLGGGGPSVVEAIVTRREDMMSLRFQFIGFTLIGEPARLVRNNPSAYVIVHFTPQSIAEQAILEYSGDPNLPTPPVKSRVSGASRLAFFVPAAITEIPFQLGTLLNWEQFKPSVVPVASVKRPFRGRPIRAPLSTETAIEAPWRLTVSPPNDHYWRHQSYPVTLNGRTDLWHTKLTPPSGPLAKGKLRAVWMPSFVRTQRPSSSSDQFRMSLNNEDRWQLIRLTSDWSTYSNPVPADVNLFALSALGAWMDFEGNWVPKSSAGLSLEHWTHQAVMGRDNYVKTVHQGYLFPFGHKAAITTITQRKFQIIESGLQRTHLAAFLRQRVFITVRQTSKNYSRRNMPFKTVRILTRQTPDLDPANNSSVVGNGAVFWPRVAGSDFRFLMVGVDMSNQEIDFTAPVIFVKASWTDKTTQIVGAYAGASLSRNQIPMNGQHVALAPPAAGKPLETGAPTQTLDFRGEKFIPTTPPWRPYMRRASIRLKAVEEIKGKDFGNKNVEFHPTYKDFGFGGQNQDAQVFVRLLSPVALDFADGADADKAGGLATPNMSISGLSRKLGPIAGKLLGDKLPPTKFDPKEFFKDAKILGGIELADILKVLDTVQKAPSIISNPVHPGGNTKLPPDKIVTEFKLQLKGTGEIKSDPLKLFEPLPNASLDLHATFVTPLFGGVPPTYKVVGELKNFKLYMIGKPDAFLILTFNRLKFSSETGKIPDVDVDIEGVAFAGALKFVNELKDFMNFGGNGLNIDVSPEKIEAGYTLSIPTVTVGIFTLANLSLAAGIKIPFTGKPLSARFSFCRPDAQFLLTYTIFGGGGFFQIIVGTDEKGGLGIELLEAGLEFGAAASIDIGVASGGVQIMAGIYFKIAKQEGCATPAVQLSGYVRLGGELDVLGIVNISVEFRMSLSYDSSDDSVWGQATLVVEVDVLFFSASVDLTVEKKFGGSGNGSVLCAPSTSSTMALLGGPAPPLSKITFADLMDAPDPQPLNEIWEEEYAAAFAPAAFG